MADAHADAALVLAHTERMDGLSQAIRDEIQDRRQAQAELRAVITDHLDQVGTRLGRVETRQAADGQKLDYIYRAALHGGGPRHLVAVSGADAEEDEEDEAPRRRPVQAEESGEITIRSGRLAFLLAALLLVAGAFAGRPLVEFVMELLRGGGP